MTNIGPFVGQQGVGIQRSAEHGIEWRGYWEKAHDGTAIATRRMVKAIELAGIPVHLGRSEWKYDSEVDPEAAIDLGGKVTPWAMGEGYSIDLRNTAAAMMVRNPVATVHHRIMRPHFLNNILHPKGLQLDPGMAASAHPYLFLLTVFERDRLAPDEVEASKKFAEVWVPCERFAAVARAQGVNAHVMPHPWPTYPISRDQLLALNYNRPSRYPDDRHLLFAHLGKWEPRKGHHEMVGAFLQAFTPATPATFLFKTSSFGTWSNYPLSLKQSISEWLTDPAVQANGWTMATASKSIRANLEPFPPDKMLAFYRACDVYVSASHGEAFDLPAFDAVLAGCRLIHTGYGGSEDFAPDNAIRTWDGHSLVPAHPGYLLGDAQWAAIDIPALANAMRRAFEERCPGGMMPDPDRFNPLRVGQLVKQRIDNHLRSLGHTPPWP